MIAGRSRALARRSAGSGARLGRPTCVRAGDRRLEARSLAGGIARASDAGAPVGLHPLKRRPSRARHRPALRPDARPHALVGFCAAAAAARRCRNPPRRAGRALLVCARRRRAARGTAAEAQRPRLVTIPHDPRTRIAACPGAPACASGQIATRDLRPRSHARRRTPRRLACACTFPAAPRAAPIRRPAALTLVGGENGEPDLSSTDGKGAPARLQAWRDDAMAASAAAPCRSGTTSGRNRRRLPDTAGPARSRRSASRQDEHDRLRLHPRRRRRSTSAPSPSSAPRPTCRAFREAEADVAVRMIHACGAGRGGAAHFVFSPGFVAAARAALAAGAPIFCDAEMVAHGVTRGRLPAGTR